MKVAITAATQNEISGCIQQINGLYTRSSKRLKVTFTATGVGLVATTFALTKLAFEEKPDVIIQAGIAGCFDKDIALGTVVAIKEEALGDMGVEENNKWKDIFDLGLAQQNFAPFEKKRLPNPWLNKYNLLKLPEVSAITISEVTTKPERIRQLLIKYAPVTESMEGAALHYTGRLSGIPFIQIRATSNYIGERDKSKWMLKTSIDNLNKCLLMYVDKLYNIE